MQDVTKKPWQNQGDVISSPVNPTLQYPQTDRWHCNMNIDLDFEMPEHHLQYPQTDRWHCNMERLTIYFLWQSPCSILKRIDGKERRYLRVPLSFSSTVNNHLPCLSPFGTEQSHYTTRSAGLEPAPPISSRSAVELQKLWTSDRTRTDSILSDRRSTAELRAQKESSIVSAGLLRGVWIL